MAMLHHTSARLSSESLLTLFISFCELGDNYFDLKCGETGITTQHPVGTMCGARNALELQFTISVVEDISFAASESLLASSCCASGGATTADRLRSDCLSAKPRCCGDSITKSHTPFQYPAGGQSRAAQGARGRPQLRDQRHFHPTCHGFKEYHMLC